MRRHAAGLCATLLLFVVAGCGGGDAPPKYGVSGTVSYGGTPVSKGTILFLPDDGKGPADGGAIVDGEFEFEATVGSKKVEIRASLDGKAKEGTEGAMPAEMNMPTPTIVEMIPEQYNSKSQIKKDVTTDASKNVFEFKLD